jgi:hypothetical protein
MTDGLVILLAWAEFVALVATLGFWVLRRQNRDPLTEAELGTAARPGATGTEGDARQRHIEPLVTRRPGAGTRRFPPDEPGNESRRQP